MLLGDLTLNPEFFVQDGSIPIGFKKQWKALQPRPGLQKSRAGPGVVGATWWRPWAWSLSVCIISYTPVTQDQSPLGVRTPSRAVSCLARSLFLWTAQSGTMWGAENANVSNSHSFPQGAHSSRLHCTSSIARQGEESYNWARFWVR